MSPDAKAILMTCTREPFVHDVFEVMEATVNAVQGNGELEIGDCLMVLNIDRFHWTLELRIRRFITETMVDDSQRITLFKRDFQRLIDDGVVRFLCTVTQLPLATYAPF